jgi:hypothetical protein
MQRIIIETIPDAAQRYNTVGDYYHNEQGDQLLFISDMGNKKYEFLIALHELIESQLCQERGTTEEMIDVFDFEFEKNRQEGDLREPGDQPEAPYFKEHQFATEIERLTAKELGVDWDKYIGEGRKLDNN